MELEGVHRSLRTAMYTTGKSCHHKPTVRGSLSFRRLNVTHIGKQC